MTRYERGFLTKCAQYGVDGRRLLVKRAGRGQTAALGAGLGALLGAGAGALSSKENRLRNAIIGALLGGGAGAGAGYGGHALFDKYVSGPNAQAAAQIEALKQEVAHWKNKDKKRLANTPGTQTHRKAQQAQQLADALAMTPPDYDEATDLYAEGPDPDSGVGNGVNQETLDALRNLR